MAIPQRTEHVAKHRQHLADAGSRSGQTVACGWGAWDVGSILLGTAQCPERLDGFESLIPHSLNTGVDKARYTAGRSNHRFIAAGYGWASASRADRLSPGNRILHRTLHAGSERYRKAKTADSGKIAASGRKSYAPDQGAAR